MQNLKDKCQQLFDRNRGGWFDIHSCHTPIVPDEYANEQNEWYVIVMPGSLWVLRASDVPAGDFPYRDVIDKVLVRIVRKTREEYEAEEAQERKLRFG